MTVARKANRKIEYVPLGRLAESGDPKNPRSHDSLGDVRESVGSLGFIDMIITDDRTGRLVAGHGRVKVLTEMQESGDEPPDGVMVDGDDWLVPVVTGWSSADDDQARRALLVLNRATETSGWDDENLLELLEDLAHTDDGLSATGFDLDYLNDLAARLDHEIDEATGEVREDDADVSVPEDPVTSFGDIWQCGDHLVVCGDATRDEFVAAALASRQPDCVFTDPPYGVACLEGVTPDDAEQLGRRRDGKTVPGDDLGQEELRALLERALGLAADRSKPGAMWYVCGPTGPNIITFGSVLSDLGVWRQTLVWVKDQMVFGRSDYHYRHETIFYGWTPGAARLHPPPERTHSSVWEIPRPTRSAEHPTMKPLALVGKALKDATNRGDLVYDPFGGAGSTLVAAEEMGRVAALVEIDPGNVDVIIRRWEETSAKKASRIGSVSPNGEGPRDG